MKKNSFFRINYIRGVLGKTRKIHLPYQGKKNEFAPTENENNNESVPNENKNNREGNYFSLITGVNGSGKSNLLAKVVNNYIFSHEYTLVDTVDGSYRSPSRVIAICNARFNRFPLRKNFLEHSLLNDTSYYILSEPNLEIGEGYREIILNCLKELTRKDSEHERVRSKAVLKDAYEMIGLSPALLITLEIDETNLNKYISKKEFTSDPFQEGKASQEGEETAPLITGDKSNNLYALSEKQIEHLKNDKIPQLVINFSDNVIKVANNKINTLNYIIPALHQNLLKIKSIQVQRFKQSKWISNHALSSGEQSLLINTIILDVFTINNSLICIDEPENSLHPEWQLKYIEYIINICKNNFGCHFLIATHSPQIISGMTSSNGCIVLLNHDDQQVKSIEEYMHQSASRQLAEVFKSPGYKNDYLLRNLVVLLAKISNDIPPLEKEATYLEDINKLLLSGLIAEYDPVRILAKQINELMRKVKS